MEKTQGSQASIHPLSRSAGICSLTHPPFLRLPPGGALGKPSQKEGLAPPSESSESGNPVQKVPWKKHWASWSTRGEEHLRHLGRRRERLRRQPAEGGDTRPGPGRRQVLHLRERAATPPPHLPRECGSQPGLLLEPTPELLSTFTSGPTSRGSGFMSLRWRLGVFIFYQRHHFLLR